MYGVRVACARPSAKSASDVALAQREAARKKWPGPQGADAGPGLVRPQQREAGGWSTREILSGAVSSTTGTHGSVRSLLSQGTAPSATSKAGRSNAGRAAGCRNECCRRSGRGAGLRALPPSAQSLGEAQRLAHGARPWCEAAARPLGAVRGGGSLRGLRRREGLAVERTDRLSSAAWKWKSELPASRTMMPTALLPSSNARRLVRTCIPTRRRVFAGVPCVQCLLFIVTCPKGRLHRASTAAAAGTGDFLVERCATLLRRVREQCHAASPRS